MTEVAISPCPIDGPITIQPYTPEYARMETPIDKDVLMLEKPRYLSEKELDQVLLGITWPTKFVTMAELHNELNKTHPTYLPVEPNVYCVDSNNPTNPNAHKIKVFFNARYGIPGAIQMVGYQALESIRENLRVKLRNKKIHPAMIPRLRERIRNKYFASQVAYGATVGISAEEALVGPIFQMTLNSFKLQGVKRKFSYSLSALSEILNASRKRSRPISIISLRDPPNRVLSIHDAIDLIPKINEITVGSLVRDSSIVTRDALDDEWINYYERLSQMTGSTFARPLPGSQQQPGVTNPETPSANVLVLVLDRVKMVGSDVTIKTIVDIIERVGQGIVTVVPTPLHVGILYVFADTQGVSRILSSSKDFKKIFSGLRGDFTSVYFRSILVPTLDDLRIQGIPGVRNFAPEAFPIWTVVADTVKLASNDYRLIWAIDFSRRTGLGSNRIYPLLTEAGIKVISRTERDARIQTERDLYHVTWRSEEDTPKFVSIIQNAGINIVKSMKMDAVVKLPSGMPPPKIDGVTSFNKIESPTEILTAMKIIGNDERPDGYYVTGTADGINLYRLFEEDYVDYRHTFANDMNKIMEVLGIEAVRNFIIYEISEVIRANGSYIDPRSIVELVNFMTNRGVPTSLSYSGTSRQKIGALTKSNIQQPFDNSLRAGFFGEEERIGNIFTTATVGRLIPQGTGSVEYVQSNTGHIYRGRELPKKPESVSVEDLNKEIELLDEELKGMEPEEEYPEMNPTYRFAQATKYPKTEVSMPNVGKVVRKFPPNQTTSFRQTVETIRSAVKSISLSDKRVVNVTPPTTEILPDPFGWAPPSIPIFGGGLPPDVQSGMIRHRQNLERETPVQPPATISVPPPVTTEAFVSVPSERQLPELE